MRLVGVNVEAGVHRVTMRSGTANAIDLEVARDLAAAIHSAIADQAPLIVLSGGARFFSAGGDLRAMRSAPDRSSYVRAIATELHGALAALADSDTLLMSVVRGVVAGAGLGLVLHADVSLCASSARFQAAYGTAGLTPDMGLSYLLPRAVGEVRARRMILLGETVDAVTAVEWGLVSETVDESVLEDREVALVAQLCAAPAARASKRLLSEAREPGLARTMDREALSIAQLFETPDAQARISAFLERAAQHRPIGT